MNRLAPAAIALLLALPGAALAKGGGGEGPDPATPAPAAAPCVSAVGQGGGVVHGGRVVKPQWDLTNCSRADETVIPHFVDHATDAWNLGRDCGPDQAWDGAPVTIKVGKPATITTSAVRAACPSAERHVIAVTFTTPAGTPVQGVGYFGWEDSRTP